MGILPYLCVFFIAIIPNMITEQPFFGVKDNAIYIQPEIMVEFEEIILDCLIRDLVSNKALNETLFNAINGRSPG